MADPGETLVSRLVKILSAFQGGESVLTVASIARVTGIPVPSAHRLVNELVRWGLLERTPDRRVRIGLRLWELAVRNSPQMRLRDRALPYLESLQGAVRQHTQLSVLGGTDVVYIETLSATEGAAVSIVKVASRLPAAACAPGMVFAAFSSPDVYDAILSAIPRAFTPETPRRPEQLRKIIDNVRATGVAVANGWIHPDVTGVAVPIRDAYGEPAAALSILVPRGSDLVETCVPALRAAAHGISRSLRSERPSDPQLNLLEYMVRQGTTQAGVPASQPSVRHSSASMGAQGSSAAGTDTA
ncbi:IclR family transcriptional regulator [Georgenia daeguensis]|uniref:IclR family transcriptional regulator n=1 Tax=Georgenia daeguensis TaxID=908355 RepID=A0ABP6UN90_9MICO